MKKQWLIQKILDGQVYCKIERVAPSGMSRCMSFYVVIDGYIKKVTRDIHNLKGYGSITKDGYLRVGGCGMDMVFATLYGSLDREQAEKRSQDYHML